MKKQKTNTYIKTITEAYDLSKIQGDSETIQIMRNLLVDHYKSKRAYKAIAKLFVEC